MGGGVDDKNNGIARVKLLNVFMGTVMFYSFIFFFFYPLSLFSFAVKSSSTTYSCN